ncbi:hypothetical protein ABVK25_010741 [Lepraria finkii]|uniref:Uncharacterized protein n=1 Tax=Lepraria finkii TaxID=1340010 RepID=A0ABR4ATF0_9LECA
MTSDIQDTPFVKQLAANDRPTREKALESLRIYLTSGRTFTSTDLRKIWKGLFFCIHHTDRPLPQQRLSTSLAALLLQLPTPLFLPFLHAFWGTIIAYWSQIPSLRLDKYLYLIRQYISHSFLYLQQHGWEGGEGGLVEGYLNLVEEMPLSARDGKVADGVRYHVFDVWVDGLVGAEGWEGQRGVVMRPVVKLGREGRTKIVRERARAVLEDVRLKESEEDGSGGEAEERGEGDEDGEFEGFGE